MEVSKTNRNRIIGFILIFLNFMVIRYLLSGYLRNDGSISIKDGLITSLCYMLSFVIYKYVEKRFML
jgi:hypothetical protein